MTILFRQHSGRGRALVQLTVWSERDLRMENGCSRADNGGWWMGNMSSANSNTNYCKQKHNYGSSLGSGCALRGAPPVGRILPNQWAYYFTQRFLHSTVFHSNISMFNPKYKRWLCERTEWFVSAGKKIAVSGRSWLLDSKLLTVNSINSIKNPNFNPKDRVRFQIQPKDRD